MLKKILLTLCLALGFHSCAKAQDQQIEIYREDIKDVVTYTIAYANYYIAEFQEFKNDVNNPYNKLLGADWNTLSTLGALSNWEKFVEKMDAFGIIVDEKYYAEPTYSYYDAVESFSNVQEGEHQKIASEILKFYNETYPRSSTAVLVKNSPVERIWKFQEINTGIEFMFILELIEGEATWSCEVVDKSIERYYENGFK